MAFVKKNKERMRIKILNFAGTCKNTVSAANKCCELQTFVWKHKLNVFI